MKMTCKAALLCLLIPTLLQGQELGALRMNPDTRESRGEAALWGGVEQGWFRPTYAPTLGWSAGARGDIVRHGANTSWEGKISFEQKTGYNMLSSMFLEPGYFPVDLLEFTSGTKSRETGRLEAGFLTDLGYEWAAGMKASFEAAYAGKKTALNHTALGVDARVEPTLSYVMDDDMVLASAAVFRFRTERITAQQSDGTLFLDKGLRYGAFQDAAGTFPVQEIAYGFSEKLFSEDIDAGLEWTWKRGTAGSTGFGNFHYPGSALSVFYKQTFQADEADHGVRIAYERQRDQLREGVSDAEGITSLSDRQSRSVELGYEVRFLHGAVKSLGLTLDGHRYVERSFTPFYDQTKRNLGTATLSVAFAFGALDLKIDAFAGGGVWRDRGRYRDETEDTSYRCTTDWNRLMDYSLAPRAGAGGSLAYRFPGHLFLQIDGKMFHALRETAMGGQNRGIGTLAIGYSF